MARRTNKEELPKVDIVLTAEEMNALNGEPAELLKLYVELSRRRDFASGIAGQVTKISDRAFKEMMEVTKKQGREPKKPTTKHIVRWLSQLEALGMIQSLGNYVFKLPKAPRHESIQKKCHQSVTKIDEKCHQNEYQSVTISMDGKTPINTVVKTNNKNEVSLNFNEKCHQNEEEVARKLGIPLKNNIHNITLHSAQDFFELLAKQGYYVNQLHNNKKTLAMVNAWVTTGITLEEAQIGINHVNSQLRRVPDTPSYYNKAVLQVRQDFKNAELTAKTELTKEVNHATPTTKHVTQRSKYDQLRERRAKWREKCEQEEKDKDGCEHNREII